MTIRYLFCLVLAIALLTYGMALLVDGLFLPGGLRQMVQLTLGLWALISALFIGGLAKAYRPFSRFGDR